jgi:hypothetical protein
MGCLMFGASLGGLDVLGDPITAVIGAKLRPATICFRANRENRSEMQLMSTHSPSRRFAATIIADTIGVISNMLSCNATESLGSARARFVKDVRRWS